MSNKNNKTLDVHLIDKYLSELSKELKKEYGRYKEFEIILVGGAAIILNYDFRGGTTDIDTFVSSGGAIKDASYRVADKFDLPSDWLNSDFRKTKSYSPHLVQYSKFYKRFSQILNVRTITREYLVAMKLISFRAYKRDKSDIVGIIETHKNSEKPISLEEVQTAVKNLYGNWDTITEEAKEFVERALSGTVSYETEILGEDEGKEILLEIEEKYDDLLNTSNVNTILEQIRAKKKSEVGDL